MLSGAPSAFAPVPLPLGGTPAILDLQNLLTATSLLLGHQALPVAPEHMPTGLQALPRPRFIPCTTDPHPGVPRAFRGLCGPSEGVRGWSASGDCGMQRGRGANSTGAERGGVPCPGEMAFLSSAVMGRRWRWGRHGGLGNHPPNQSTHQGLQSELEKRVHWKLTGLLL